MGLWPIFVGRTHLAEIASQLSIGGYHHSWKFVNGEQSCADLSVLHLQWYQPTKNSFSFAPEKHLWHSFFAFFRSCQSATPQKKTSNQKKVSHPPHLFFWGAPLPKKNPPTKKPLPAFQQFPFTFFFSKPLKRQSGRGGKNSTESGRTLRCRCLGLTFEAARAGEDHKCPTRGAALAGGDGCWVVGFVKRREWTPPQKRLGGLWIFGFELFFLLVKKGREDNFLLNAFF